MKTNTNEIVYGFNSVMNILTGKRVPTKVLIMNNHHEPKITSICKEKGIYVESVDRHVLDRLSNNRNHQGVLAYVPPYEYGTLEDLINDLNKKNDALILILDGIEDPNNFGSLIRSSACLGIDGILISKNHQVQLTPTVSKVSTGGEEHIRIYQVSNIAQSLIRLKKNGLWIVASDGSADRDYDEVNYKGKIGIVVGSEGKGISPLILKTSDFIVKIPMEGKITSFNAAVAGAILLTQAMNYKRRNK